jgi:peroxiredoxin/mono/diheme cytochrome c family protein
MRKYRCLLALTGLFLLAPIARPDEPPAAGKPGKQVTDFTLTDTTGRAWSLDGLKDRKAVVVVFVGTECPISNAYLPRLAELSRDYEPKGVQLLAVNANRQDSPERVAEHARKNALPFPVLKDGGNAVADLLGAERTPEAFVLDPGRVIRYRGRVDDQNGVGYQRPRPTRRDLAEALDEVLAGKDVTQSMTPVAGCRIGRVRHAPAEGAVTYGKQVSRILQRHCQECHRPGQVGPFSLMTYEDAAAWSETIREVVQERRMPPWHADPHYGKFANDRSLTDEDREALLTWVKQGCPEGDPAHLPPAREFVSDWRIGKPDVVFSMTREFQVPAKAPARGVPYQYFVVPTNFTEDVWVQAAEARPGNRAVVHHIIVYVRMPGQRRERNEDGIGNGMLVAFAPGDMPLLLEPGSAKKVPKGADLVFQMHYTPNGTEQADRSSVGLVFAKGPPKHEVRTRAIAQQLFSIPAGAKDYRVKSSAVFREDAQLLTLMPHMHLRGKDFEYRVVYPDGRSEVLLSVPRWDFGWQSGYRLAQPLRLPAGTRVECTAHFDNSADNPNNPDPTKAVAWGDQTWEEMMIGFVDYAAE